MHQPLISPAAQMMAGVLLFLIGLGYFFRPDILERINSFIRNTLLNDSRIALERKKWGLFFMLMGFLLFYLGVCTK